MSGAVDYTRTQGDTDVHTWATLATVDTPIPIENVYTKGLAGSVMFAGTFGGATVSLMGSNDAVNWFALKDLTGTVISATAAGLFEFSTSALFLAPLSVGGTADVVAVTVALRG